jgi:dTDP-glucose 4,6-dehydratase
MRALVTGGAGFLGSHFVRDWLGTDRGELFNLDLLTYAGSPGRVADVADDARYGFGHADVADAGAVSDAFRRFRPDVVVHFAAESHVTRSERDPEAFTRTNVAGTRVMLEAAAVGGVSRFVHISTDETYGPRKEGHFREEDKLLGEGRATSPYARSKALADDVAVEFRSELDVVVLRPTNCFGPWQYPEKAFARWVTRVLSGRTLPVWGGGGQVRQWLYAGDLVRAVHTVLDARTVEPVYNVGPRHSPEITNKDLATWLLTYLGLPAETLVLTEYDRPNHDARYAVDPGRIERLGWRPGDVWDRFGETVEWYRGHEDWWTPLVDDAESIYTDLEPFR